MWTLDACFAHTHTHTHTPEAVDEGTISKLPVSERESTSRNTDSDPHALLLVLSVSATMEAGERRTQGSMHGNSLASATCTCTHTLKLRKH